VPREAQPKFFLVFRSAAHFFQKRVLVHSKTKLLSLSRSVNVTMFHAYRILPRCHSQAMLHRGDCSTINFKVRAMNISIRLKSVAAKAATAATVRTPLLYILCICPMHIISYLGVKELETGCSIPLLMLIWT